jgi:hypothetical protein
MKDGLEEMKKNIGDMMDIDVKTRLILAKIRLGQIMRSEENESGTTEND